MNYCLPLRYATMGGYLDPEAFWRLTVVNLQDLGTSLTVNLGTSSQDVFAARGGRARPGRLDQAEEARITYYARLCLHGKSGTRGTRLARIIECKHRKFQFYYTCMN